MVSFRHFWRIWYGFCIRSLAVFLEGCESKKVSSRNQVVLSHYPRWQVERINFEWIESSWIAEWQTFDCWVSDFFTEENHSTSPWNSSICFFWQLSESKQWKPWIQSTWMPVFKANPMWTIWEGGKKTTSWALGIFWTFCWKKQYSSGRMSCLERCAWFLVVVDYVCYIMCSCFFGWKYVTTRY